MRTACLFWPGSEAEIAGHRPTWYARFDSGRRPPMPFSRRASTMPSRCFVSPMPTAPTSSPSTIPSPTTRGTSSVPTRLRPRWRCCKMDAVVGKLKAALDKTGLPIDLVVVSDHGMVKIEGGGSRWTNSPTSPDSSRRHAALRQNGGGPRRASTTSSRRPPRSSLCIAQGRAAGLNYNQNPREGDPVIVATGPYAIRAHEPPAGTARRSRPSRAMHGFDPHKIRR